MLPDPVREHYAVVHGRRYPPKQVLACVTGLDRADFTTHLSISPGRHMTTSSSEMYEQPARHARAALTIAGHRYDAPVAFCDPWPFPFSLLGQEGFLRYFRVTPCAAEYWLEVEPE